ncbi:hypothetical protein [Pseudomonas putida]|uniref:hypothetical protein n=1 Tax=Pseudomonas putida TaxID=303 RepID=UPI0011C04245|nr:hypothetical protein [Pseudomonas putida]
MKKNIHYKWLTPFIALMHDEAVPLIGGGGKGIPDGLRGNAGRSWSGKLSKRQREKAPVAMLL